MGKRAFKTANVVQSFKELPFIDSKERVFDTSKNKIRDAKCKGLSNMKLP